MYYRMGIVVAIFILIWSITFKNNDTEDNFLEMITKNLTAIQNHILPLDNRNLYDINPEETKIFDYGIFDFVIVGAGSAGCLLANRLSEYGNWSVLLLEAGGSENAFSDIPGLGGYLLLSDMNWGYNSTSQTTCCLGMRENKCSFQRGKVVGGSSVLNGKMYVRGNKEDFNGWEEMGNTGWNYESVLPYFKKMENNVIEGLDEGYHGTTGLLGVNYTEQTLYHELFIKASIEVGHKHVKDYNGIEQIGASRVQFTIHNNKIASSGRAFIHSATNRANLNVTINAYATKIIIDDVTKTALGVQFVKDGKLYSVSSSKEVILSAGAINTPQLLLLSGIGPKENLQKQGIKVIADLPVGKNLTDHPVYLPFILKTNITLFSDELKDLMTDYFDYHRPLTTPYGVEGHSFISLRNDSSPDIQIIFLVPPGFGTLSKNVFNLNDETTKAFEENYNASTDLFIWVVLLQPKSRGKVTLKSTNPVDFPDIDLNYFSDEENEDIETLYQGIQEAWKLAQSESFKSVNASYVSVVRGCSEFTEFTRDYWYCAIRQLGSTLFHPCSTTRMGLSSAHSVVSPDARVHGMGKLRIVDAGIMPRIVSGNPNAAIYMMAEKISDDIKADYNVMQK